MSKLKFLNREGLTIFSLLMPINVNQYRGTVGDFSNHNLPTRKTQGLFSCRSLQKTLQKFTLLKY